MARTGQEEVCLPNKKEEPTQDRAADTKPADAKPAADTAKAARKRRRT